MAKRTLLVSTTLYFSKKECRIVGSKMEVKDLSDGSTREYCRVNRIPSGSANSNYQNNLILDYLMLQKKK